MWGIVLIVAGSAMLVLYLPGALLGLSYPKFVAATIALVLITAGRVVRSASKQEQELPAAGDEAPRNAPSWEVPVFFGAILVLGLWAFWFLNIGRLNDWDESDEREWARAPVWQEGVEAFSGSMRRPETEATLVKRGFRAHCYRLGPGEGIARGDTDVCWAIAKSAWGIPARRFSLFFGKEGLRQVRMDFPKEQWPAIEAWSKGLEGVPVGDFGQDMGGNIIKGKALKNGLVLTAEPDHLPSVTVLWQSPIFVQETVCKNVQAGQWELLCRTPESKDAQ